MIDRREVVAVRPGEIEVHYELMLGFERPSALGSMRARMFGSTCLLPKIVASNRYKNVDAKVGAAMAVCTIRS
jgi:hypothetical protein